MLLVTLFTNVVAMISCSPGCLDQVIWLHISTVMAVCRVPKMVGMMELQLELQ